MSIWVCSCCFFVVNAFHFSFLSAGLFVTGFGFFCTMVMFFLFVYFSRNKEWWFHCFLFNLCIFLSLGGSRMYFTYAIWLVCFTMSFVSCFVIIYKVFFDSFLLAKYFLYFFSLILRLPSARVVNIFFYFYKYLLFRCVFFSFSALPL